MSKRITYLLNPLTVLSYQDMSLSKKTTRDDFNLESDCAIFGGGILSGLFVFLVLDKGLILCSWDFYLDARDSWQKLAKIDR